MAVHITRVYTKVGDNGTSALGDGSRVSKTDPRLAAYADVDEANAAIGVALALGELPDELIAVLTQIQNDLFDVGADLCSPVVEAPKWPPLRVTDAQVERLEGWCDEFNERLEPLNSFVLPGGTPAAAQLHVCRTVCRRAERRTIACGDDVSPECVRYLNRLSDLLFGGGRVLNREAGIGEVQWRHRRK